jgi:hypothetical protein
MPIARNRITAIIQRLRDLEDWHEVEVGKTQLLQVGYLGLDASQIGGIQIDLWFESLTVKSGNATTYVEHSP